MAAAAAPRRKIEIRAQDGFQRDFLTCKADIVIGGGGAGVGKTFAEIIAPLRHLSMVRGFFATIFRRTTKQITNPGGLWDEAAKLYPLLGAVPNKTDLEWKWDSTASKVKMAHLEHEDNVYDWQGAQIALIIFDELTHFTSKQFWYMLSRNRTTCGIRPQVLATCNPDADSWVATLIEWWIDQDKDSPTYGLAIPERAGVIRYFSRIGDTIIWGDSPAEVVEKCSDVDLVDVKSLTFIPGKLEDNKILTAADPGYRGNLKALSRVESLRLLGNNWKARATAGDVFRTEEVRMLDAIPDDAIAWVRQWDLAATEPSSDNPDPDWSCGVKMGLRPNGRYVVAHVEFLRKRSHLVRQKIKEVAEGEPGVKIWFNQDPAQAGKDQAEGLTMFMAGFAVETERETGDKVTRADAFSAQWQAGNVDVVIGPWNAEYFSQMSGFPGAGVHDDAVDASAGAFKHVAKSLNMWDVL